MAPSLSIRPLSNLNVWSFQTTQFIANQSKVNNQSEMRKFWIMKPNMQTQAPPILKNGPNQFK